MFVQVQWADSLVDARLARRTAPVRIQTHLTTDGAYRTTYGLGKALVLMCNSTCVCAAQGPGRGRRGESPKKKRKHKKSDKKKEHKEYKKEHKSKRCGRAACTLCVTHTNGPGTSHTNRVCGNARCTLKPGLARDVATAAVAQATH